MSQSGQETEAKFYVRDLRSIERRLQNLEARLLQPRVLETNIRFDLPDAGLRSEGRVLRLRRDTESRLTYKSASTNDQGVLSRTEIEFTVGEFEKAKQFLEALGYQKLIYYEKYRTTYTLQPSEGSARSTRSGQRLLMKPSEGLIHIMLDELPYGNFVEIEGETVDSIRAVAEGLDLIWERAIATSYHALFERGRTALKYSFQDLSFENFADIQVAPSHLGVRAADDAIN
jgi:adenylate cyclase class 2